MHQYKIITRFLLILPIINFAFALPIAEQETHQVCADVVPDVATTMSAKRGDGVGNRMYFERLSGKPDSDLAGLKALQPEAPDHGSSGSMDPPQMGTSEIEQVSPGLSKSPSEASLDHYLARPASEASLEHYLESPKSDASAGHYLTPPESDVSFAPADGSMMSTDSESGLSRGAASESGQSTMKNFLSKVVSKLRFWRRISGPVSVRDAVNAAQRDLQILADTGAPMVRDIEKSLNVLPTPTTRGVRHPAAGKPL